MTKLLKWRWLPPLPLLAVIYVVSYFGPLDAPIRRALGACERPMDVISLIFRLIRDHRVRVPGSE